MSERTIRLVREGFPDRMTLDTAVSSALLSEAAQGAPFETLRLSVPGRSLAFGRHDAVSPGFADAVEAARAAGFEPFVRLAGGRAAIFHQRTVAISWTIPDRRPIDGIRTRFAAVAGLLVAAFRTLGIPAEIGAIPGEYCPGAFSIHVGAGKVAGIGQRLARSAAHVGGVIVVDDGDVVRRVLVPVYEALGLDWDPSTAGALSDTIPGLEPGVIIDAIVDRLAGDAEIAEETLSGHIIEIAEERAPDFAPG